MSEINKLYENAGVSKEPAIILSSGEVIYWKNYSPFTAEKQLKILCFIVNKKHSVTFHAQIFSGDRLTLEKIQENLAWAINRIWQDLTSEEKEVLRGILRA